MLPFSHPLIQAVDNVGTIYVCGGNHRQEASILFKQYWESKEAEVLKEQEKIVGGEGSEGATITRAKHNAALALLKDIGARKERCQFGALKSSTKVCVCNAMIPIFLTTVHSILPPRQTASERVFAQGDG